MSVLLDMTDEWKLFFVVVNCDMIIHRLFFRRIVHSKFCDREMSAETVHLVFYRLLKPEHDKKRYQHCGQPNADAYYSYLVNSGSETLLLFETDSFRYEI